MSLQKLTVVITGNNPLLLNNPQCVDSFNRYSKAKKVITAKRAKTDDDQMALRRLDLESKLYWNDEKGHVYVPTTWLMAAIAGRSFRQAKISKADIRGSVFTMNGQAKLNYDGIRGVSKIEDIVDDEKFTHLMLLKQGQVRIPKVAPIFHNWSFSVDLEFDPSIIDEASLTDIIEQAAAYGGFGDFRPTFGRATAVVKASV